jgi:hypothetical protein
MVSNLGGRRFLLNLIILYWNQLRLVSSELPSITFKALNFEAGQDIFLGGGVPSQARALDLFLRAVLLLHSLHLDRIPDLINNPCRADPNSDIRYYVLILPVVVVAALTRDVGWVEHTALRVEGPYASEYTLVEVVQWEKGRLRMH